MKLSVLVTDRRAAAGRAGMLAVLGAVLWVGGVSSTGCGGSDDGPVDAAIEGSTDAVAEAAEPCPATANATLGAPCASEGLTCAPEYSCDLVQTPLECTCTRGVFVCIDVTGAVVREGGAPHCPPAIDAGCPDQERAASGAACSDVGLSCVYPSACGVGVDSCVCAPAGIVGAGPSFVFQCSLAACGTPNDGAPPFEDAADSGDATEAGTPDGADASPDATEAGSLDSADASPDATVDGGAESGSAFDATSD